MGYFLSVERKDSFQLSHFIFIVVEAKSPAVFPDAGLAVMVAIPYHTGWVS